MLADLYWMETMLNALGLHEHGVFTPAGVTLQPGGSALLSGLHPLSLHMYHPRTWQWQDSNPGSSDLKSDALTTRPREIHDRKLKETKKKQKKNKKKTKQKTVL